MKLAIFLGGLGYHCDKPLLYYAREMAYDKGYTEYVNIDYNVKLKNLGSHEENLQRAFEEVFTVAEEKLASIDWNKYNEILFISKSIGTAVAAAYVEKYTEVFAEKKLKNVYLTPLAMTFTHHPKKGIAFSGTKDAWIVLEDVIALAKQHEIQLHIIEDTNHSLEGDDLWRNMDILKDVMLRIYEYLG